MCSCVLISALPPCGSLGPVGRQKPQSKLNGGSLIQGIIASDKRVTVRSRETLCGSLGLSECAQGRTNYQTFPPQWRKRSLACGTAGEFAGLARPELAQGFWTSHRPPSAVRVRRSWSAARHIGEQRRSGCWWGAGGLQSLGAKLGLWCPCPHGCRKVISKPRLQGLREARFWAVTGPYFTNCPHIHTTSPCAGDWGGPLPPSTGPPASLLRKLNVTRTSKEKCLKCHRSPQSIYHIQSWEAVHW